MKILQVTPTFIRSRFGGITRVSYNLAKFLVKGGHDVTVYTTDINDRYSRIPDANRVNNIDGINVHYFKNLSNLLASKRLFLPKGLFTVTKREIKNFDVVHIHGYRDSPAVIIHYYAKRFGIPYVLQAHGSTTTFFHRGIPKRIFDKLWGYEILRDAAKLIALTRVEVKQYGSLGVSEDRIEIISNGVDLSEFDNLPQRGEFRKKYGLGGDQKIILYLGRINKIKGLDLLAGAFADLSTPVNDIKLVIVGPDDGYLSSLKKVVAALKISDKVIFIGPLFGQEKLEAYVDADVYVLPSYYEIFSLTVLEALACGTPVIVTDRCGIADVISGQTGLVVPYDKDQLRDALLHILADNKMRLEFGEKGKSLVREKFNWEKIAGQIESLYLDCLK